MNFLLVYPKIPETYWSYSHALAFIGKKALMPPLALATIAAMIPDRVSVRVIDMNAQELSDADIANADLVLVSAMIVQRVSFREVVERCTVLLTPVAAGGPYPTSCPEEMQGVDYLIQGEAELIFPEFLEEFLTGVAQPVYTASSYPDMRISPVPRFDLFDMQLYDTMPIQFSRGCPFDCEFCDIVHLFGNVPRTKSPDQFLRELDAVYSTGFRGSLFIVDDNFIGNKSAVKKLLSEIAVWQHEHGNPYFLSTEASLNLAADDELLDVMVRANFSMVFVGMETPVENSLVEAGKQQNLRIDMESAVRKIQSRGIEVTGGFIIGFDSDPDNIVELQVEFVQKLAIPVAMVGLLTALPHTQLYRRLLREDRLVQTSSGDNMRATEMNFRPRKPMDQVLSGYRLALRRIYEPSRYFNRCLELLSRLPAMVRQSTETEAPHIAGRSLLSTIRLRETRGFFQSLFRQSFSWYGISYLRFIFIGLWKYPRRIVNVFSMAIQGHHFFIITRDLLESKAMAPERVYAATSVPSMARFSGLQHLSMTDPTEQQ
jgi:radical SAM superfamily enzyme YgiQ (UPF0313 family)